MKVFLFLYNSSLVSLTHCSKVFLGEKIFSNCSKSFNISSNSSSSSSPSFSNFFNILFSITKLLLWLKLIFLSCIISNKSNLYPSFFILSSSVTILWSSWNLINSWPNIDVLLVSSKGLFNIHVKFNFGRSISSSSSSSLTFGPDSMKLYVFIFVSKLSELIFNLLDFLFLDFFFFRPFLFRLKIFLSIFYFK